MSRGRCARVFLLPRMEGSILDLLDQHTSLADDQIAAHLHRPIGPVRAALEDSVSAATSASSLSAHSRDSSGRSGTGRSPTRDARKLGVTQTERREPQRSKTAGAPIVLPPPLTVVVVRGGRAGGLFRTEPDDLLTAVEPRRVVHDHVRDVESRRSRGCRAGCRSPARGECRFRARRTGRRHLHPPRSRRCPAAVDGVVAGPPGRRRSLAGVHDVVPVVRPDVVVSGPGVDEVGARGAVEVVGAVRPADEVELRRRSSRGERKRAATDANRIDLSSCEPPCSRSLTHALSQPRVCASVSGA